MICFRCVDKDFEIQGDLIGLHALLNIKADRIVKVILDVIDRTGLKIKNARGQSYDGAATM